MSTPPEPGVTALSESDIASLATAWVRYWKAPDGLAEKESLFWISGKERDLVSDSPADGWRRHDPAFASLLGGVWRNAMSEAVGSRVQAVRNRGGWDGEP